MRYLLIVLMLASCDTQAKENDALKKKAIYALTRAQNLGAAYLVSQASENMKKQNVVHVDHTEFYAYITSLSMKTSLYYQESRKGEKFDRVPFREIYRGFKSMSHRPMSKVLKTNTDLVLSLLYSVLYGTPNTR